MHPIRGAPFPAERGPLSLSKLLRSSLRVCRIRSFRCSSVPCSWGTWPPNLSAGFPAAPLAHPYTEPKVERREILLIPGPVSVEPEVLEALSYPVRAHYGADWAQFYRRLTGSLARIFKTETDPLLLFGPGTAAIEACFASTLARGDEVAVVANGLFGERMVDVAAAM